MKIAAGTVLVLETGEHSDYTFTGPFKVLKEFDQRQIVEQFRAQWVEPENYWREGEGPDTDEFIGWLNKNGYIEDIENVSWHIGSYGRLEPEIAPTDEEIEAAEKLKREAKAAHYRKLALRSDPNSSFNKPWIKKK